jgi:hypothetical protein
MTAMREAFPLKWLAKYRLTIYRVNFKHENVTQYQWIQFLTIDSTWI